MIGSAQRDTQACKKEDDETHQPHVDEGEKEQEEHHDETPSNDTAENASKKLEKKWRAKLYQLNSEGGWDDLGTGYCHVNPQQ